MALFHGFKMALFHKIIHPSPIIIIINPSISPPDAENPRKSKPPTFRPKSMASWTCSKCTFINSPSQKSICQICLTSQTQAPSSPSKPKRSCKSCTFLNSYRNNCEICGTRASASLLSTLENDDDELDSTVGNVFLPLQSCKRKNRENPVEIRDDGDDDDVGTGGFHGVKSANKTVVVLDQIHSSKDLITLKVLSYNVWFREDLEMHERMKALGDLIQQHSPDLICLQEVTPNIYDIFQQSGWWKLYKCSVSNKMAFTRPYFCMQTLQTRLDRFLCCLRDFRIDGIEMMGMEAIPGLSYCKERKLRREVKNLVLPVLPSDHYGLLLTISSR